MDKIKLKKYFAEKCNKHLFKWEMKNQEKFQVFDNNIKIYRGEGLGVDVLLNLEDEIKNFYAALKGWKVKWMLKPELGIDIEGSINILPIEEVLIGDVDFLPEKYPVMKNFTLLDYFYNEAAVGFYLDQPEKGLFYFEFDANPQKLNLDFKGYLEMLKYTKGAAYWQKSVIEPIIDETSSPTIEKMNKLFPEITVKGFYELYNTLRIDE
ncbi:hypothetical protein [Aquimarina longa]|uniref:hypothetical protein n=1 Tax=Aquimarina longa TaxID=1080221 RepID=UPI00078318EB|nr:hypothetical protein [Aquimarina longa]